MSTNMAVKVGDSFDFVGAIEILDYNDQPVTYAEWSIVAEVVLFGDRRRKVQLSASWLNPETGLVRIVGSTDDWKPGAAQIDVKFTNPETTVVSTETLTFKVTKD